MTRRYILHLICIFPFRTKRFNNHMGKKRKKKDEGLVPATPWWWPNQVKIQIVVTNRYFYSFQVSYLGILEPPIDSLIQSCSRSVFGLVSSKDFTLFFFDFSEPNSPFHSASELWVFRRDSSCGYHLGLLTVTAQALKVYEFFEKEIILYQPGCKVVALPFISTCLVASPVCSLASTLCFFPSSFSPSLSLV